MTSKEPVIDSVECNGKNKLKGGNPNNPHLSYGKDLIEQAFSSN